MSAVHNPRLQTFAQGHQLSGISERSLRAIIDHASGYSVRKAKRFLEFQQRIQCELLQHRIITDNHYTAWFSQGRQSREQLRAFIVQFSVFSNQFLVAQLQKMINADTLESMRTSKEILANEIGVLFSGPRAAATPGGDKDLEGDPELVATEGSVDGGTFRFRAAHFEWLLGVARPLDLGFSELGTRRHATPSTLFFCDELIRLYGSADYRTSQAASYAIENWAAAGFWDELVQGVTGYNERTGARLPRAFFSWHARLEAQHALHTQQELEELYCTTRIDEDHFIRIGNEMLDGTAAFWDGLEQQRRQIGGGV